MSKRLFIPVSIVFCLLFFIFLEIAQGQDAGIEISPHVIDEKAIARDLFKYTVKLKNNTDGKVTLYPMVNDISVEEGRQRVLSPDQLDRTESIARWIKIPRGGIPLMPGDEKELDLEINVSMYAIPGKRYAIIGFPDGPNRYDAEASMADKSYAQILINIEVGENIVEKSQIQLFRATRNVFLKYPVVFESDIENFGNRDIYPSGAIFIYNRKGEEVAKIDVNSELMAISPEKKEKIRSEWVPNQAFGKYKARLELEYGQIDKRDLMDTVYFWVLPLPFLLVFSGAFLLFVLLLTIFIFRKTYNSAKHPGLVPRDDGVIDLKNNRS